MSGMKTASAAMAIAVFGLLGAGPAAHAAEKILKIGAPLPLTGGLAPEGLRMKAGYDLWAKQQNDAGGIKAGSDTYKVEISYTDYQSNTTRAVQSAELMITEAIPRLPGRLRDEARRRTDAAADLEPAVPCLVHGDRILGTDRRSLS